MRRVRVERDDGAFVCEARVANHPLTRMRGLVGRDRLGKAEGLLLRPASAIHTHFMRFPIDVVFLDAEYRVKDVVENVRPWRIATSRGARQVLELGAGECAAQGVRAGDRLVAVELGA